MDALLARSLQTMRGRFESLRAGGPIPALMAEAPPGHEVAGKGKTPPGFSFGGRKPAMTRASTFLRDGQPTLFRWVWLMGEPAAVDKLNRACVDAAGFAPAIRAHSGLPRDSGAPKPEDQWTWTVFELAERGIPFSPLHLVNRAVVVATEAAPYMKAPQALVAHAKASPGHDGPDPMLSALEFGPTRYWELADLVEASLMALDLFEVAVSTPHGPTEAAKSLIPSSSQPATTPPPRPFTGGAAWEVGQRALAAVRILEELSGSPTDQRSGEAPSKTPAQPPASVDEIKAAARDGAEEGTKKALAESKTGPKPRGKTTCERLEDLHVNVDSHFAISSTIRELSERIQKSEATINDSHYYQTKLREPRREYRLMEQARKRAEREARRWGNFDSVSRRDEASEGPEGLEDL